MPLDCSLTRPLCTPLVPSTQRRIESRLVPALVLKRGIRRVVAALLIQCAAMHGGEDMPPQDGISIHTHDCTCRLHTAGERGVTSEELESCGAHGFGGGEEVAGDGEEGAVTRIHQAGDRIQRTPGEGGGGGEGGLAASLVETVEPRISIHSISQINREMDG